MMTMKNMLMPVLLLFALASFGCASGGYYSEPSGYYDAPGGYGYYEYDYPSPYRHYRGYHHRDDRHDFRGGDHKRHRGGDHERGHGDRHDREYEKD